MVIVKASNPENAFEPKFSTLWSSRIYLHLYNLQVLFKVEVMKGNWGNSISLSKTCGTVSRACALGPNKPKLTGLVRGPRLWRAGGWSACKYDWYKRAGAYIRHWRHGVRVFFPIISSFSFIPVVPSGFCKVVWGTLHCGSNWESVATHAFLPGYRYRLTQDQYIFRIVAVLQIDFGITTLWIYQ